MPLIRKYNEKTKRYENVKAQRKATPRERKLEAQIEAIRKCSNIVQVRKILA